MTRHRMELSKNLLAGIITMMIGFTASAIITTIYLFIAGIILDTLIFIFDILAIFVIIFFSQRKKTALTGKAQKAKVICVSFTSGILNECEVEYEYKTEAKEEVRGIAYISGKDYPMFKRLINIPVKVKDEYGVFVIDDVKKFYKEACAKKEEYEKNHSAEGINININGKNIKVNVEPTNKFVRCEFCGSNIKANEATCPHCGAPAPKVK